MPYAVSKWPHGNDPRSATFNVVGFDSTGVPPYHYVLKTTNASGVLAIFNDGVLIPFASEVGNAVGWSLAAEPGQPVSVIMASDGWQIEDSPDPPNTQAISGVLSVPLGANAVLSLHRELPQPIQKIGPLPWVGNAAFDALAPDDWFLIPANSQT